jgi:hypothetical protein
MPGFASTGAIGDEFRDVPSFEEALQMATGRAGRVAAFLGSENPLLHVLFALYSGMQQAGAHGDGDAGASDVGTRAGDDPAFVLQLLHHVRGEDDDVDRLATSHQARRVHTTHRFDLDVPLCGLLERTRKVGQ